MIRGSLNKVDEPASSRVTFFGLLGGVEKVRELVERFYDIMNSDPKTTGIRAMLDIGIEEQAMLKLAEALWDVADFMRNRPAA